jgi:hypothetical protein
MDYLKLAFVILFCIPILFLGVGFLRKLIDNALAKKKERLLK